jgi:spore maturation protein CgeB
MRIVMFYHSLRSDWNHGNAHFVRGIATELLARGHDVVVYEPADAWSAMNLAADHGPAALDGYRAAYPQLEHRTYDLRSFDVHAALDNADLVLVHEWTAHELVAQIGCDRVSGGAYALLFHDTHHRAATEPEQMAAYDLRHYDGVLAFGRAVADIYLREGWAENVFVWHESADTRIFKPIAGEPRRGDLVWVGNWGDDERSAELREFLIEPVVTLGLEARIYGVRYPDDARAALRAAHIEYGGWLANYKVPCVFAGYRATVHVPRRPYVRALPGIPTIRVFEALACGIPLVSAPWEDVEELFTPGADYLVARNGAEMRRHLRDLMHDEPLASALSAHGLATIRARHTCAHRVDELLGVLSCVA